MALWAGRQDAEGRGGPWGPGAVVRGRHRAEAVGTVMAHGHRRTSPWGEHRAHGPDLRRPGGSSESPARSPRPLLLGAVRCGGACRRGRAEPWSLCRAARREGVTVPAEGSLRTGRSGRRHTQVSQVTVSGRGSCRQADDRAELSCRSPPGRGMGGGRRGGHRAQDLRTGGSAGSAWGWAAAGRRRSAPCGSCTRTAEGGRTDGRTASGAGLAGPGRARTWVRAWA